MATGGKGAGDDNVGMPVESPKALPSGGGPQFHRAVLRAAQNGGAIGSKGAGSDCVAMSSE
jgi:hypothetical protein